MIDQVSIRFDEDKLFLLNIALGIIMYGVALSLKLDSFTQIKQQPKAILTGVAAQFLLLPALTAFTVWLIAPLPSLALGMILVAACPGGNVSNFFTSLAGGNVALSICLTVIASIAATFITPFSFLFWSKLVMGDDVVTRFSLEWVAMAKTIAMVIVVPLGLGVVTAVQFPRLTNLLKTPIKYVSMLILIAFITVAFSNNVDIFLAYYDYVLYLVLLHNGLALLSGYGLSKLMGMPREDTVTITIETGIQNSGLGLVIIFAFFDGNGAMAIITAWWGIWHIISGFVITQVFAYRQRETALSAL